MVNGNPWKELIPREQWWFHRNWILLQLGQTWYKASLIKGNSNFSSPELKTQVSFSDKGPCPFPREDNYEIAKMHWQNFKIFFSRNTGSISTKLCTNNPCVKRTKGLLNKDYVIMRKEMIGFLLSKSKLWYNYSFQQLYLLIWTDFSGERCYPWANVSVTRVTVKARGPLVI